MLKSINKKIEKITLLQNELFEVRNKLVLINDMMRYYLEFNAQNAKISIGFEKEIRVEQTGDKKEFNEWMDEQRAQFFIPFGLIQQIKESQNKVAENKLEIEINHFLLAQIMDVITQNLIEKEKSILFELKNLLK